MPNPNIHEPTSLAKTGRNAAVEANRTAKVVANGSGKVAEEAARAGADVARQSAETAQDAFRSSLNTATQSFRHVTDQFTQALGFSGPDAEELARKASQNMEAVTQASTVLAQGAQEISREWFGLAQARFKNNMEGLNTLARCRSVQDFVSAQSSLMRDNMQQLTEGGRRLAELSVTVADEAARTFQPNVKNTDRARSAA